MPTAEEIRNEAGILEPQGEAPVFMPSMKGGPLAPIQTTPPVEEDVIEEAPQPPIEEEEVNYAPIFSGETTQESINQQNKWLDDVGGEIILGTDIKQHAEMYQLQQLKPFLDYDIATKELARQRAEELEQWLIDHKPTWLESSVAMLEEENWLSALIAAEPVPHSVVDPNYNPLRDPDLEEYQKYAHLWYLSTSKEETTAILTNIKNQEWNRDIIARSGTGRNILTGVLAGMGSPTLLAGMAATPTLLAKAGLLGVSAGKSIAIGTGFGATITGIDEVLLHDQNSLRTLDQSALNMTASLVFDTVIGTALVGSSKAAGAYASARDDAIDYLARGGPEDVNLTQSLMDYTDSAGAMRASEAPRVDRSQISWKSPMQKILFETALAMSKITPLGKLLTSDSSKVRALALDLLETNVGVTGERGAVAVESSINMEIIRTSQVLVEANKQIKAYQKAYRSTENQFWADVDAAMRRGDRSDIPEVKAIADAIRKRIDQLYTEAAAAGVPNTYKTIIEKDPVTGAETSKRVPRTQTTAESYAMRQYDAQQVIKHAVEFEKALEQGLRANRKKVNSQVNADVGSFKKSVAKQVGESRRYIQNAPAEKANLQSLIRSKKTAMQGNAREIGRLKGIDKNDSRIATLTKKIREIEKSIKKVNANIKKIDVELKASRKFLSSYKKKIKEIQSKFIPRLQEHEIDNYTGAYYKSVTGMKMGDMQHGFEPSVFKHRQEIEDRFLEPFLVKNGRDQLIRLTNQLAPRTHMQKTFGNITLKEQLDDIGGEISEAVLQAEKAGNFKAAKKLRKDLENARTQIPGVRDRLLMTRIDPTNNRVLNSYGNAILYFNITTKLNSQLISSLPEIAKLTSRYGLTTFAKIMAPKIRNMIPLLEKTPPSSLELLGSAANRAAVIKPAQSFDIYDATPTTQVEARARWLADMTHKVSFQNFFDGTFRGAAAIAWGDMFTKAVKAGDARKLLRMGFDESEIAIIARELPLNARLEGGIQNPHFETWNYGSDVIGFNSTGLKDKIETLVIKETNTAIIKPGAGDRPLFMDAMSARILLQFKSFLLAATNRTMLPISQNNTSMWKHTLSMGGMGMLASILYQASKGQEINLDPEYLAFEGAIRGGFLGYATDVFNIGAKVTGWGPQASRYQSRNVVGALAGPTFGTATDFFSMLNMGIGPDGEPLVGADARMRAARKLIPFNNHFLMRRPIDLIEASTAEMLGGEGKARTPRRAGSNKAESNVVYY